MKRSGWLMGAAVWLVASASAFAGSRTVTVIGTIDDSLASVMVNGTPATRSADSFSATITLTKDGSNTITATATDAAGNSSSASVTVSLDTVLPVIVITSPSEGQLYGAQ